MKKNHKLAIWTINHAWVILVSYLSSLILLLIIQGSFGFTMKDDGTYLSNASMHTGSGFILALGTGILQNKTVKEHFHVSFYRVWPLIIGFVLAELLAGILVWKQDIYRGLMNIFNTSNHLNEALIFAFAGLVAGILQSRLLRPHYKKSLYWIVSISLGRGLLILSTDLGFIVFLIGAIIYGFISGSVFYRILDIKPQNKNVI